MKEFYNLKVIKKALGPEKKVNVSHLEQLLWSATSKQRWGFETHLNLCTSRQQLQSFQQPRNLHDMYSYDLFYLEESVNATTNLIPMYSLSVPLQKGVE